MMSDRLSKRHSSRLRQRASQQPVSKEEEDGLRSGLIATLMAEIRHKRDEMEQSLARDFENSRIAAEEIVRDTVKDKMEKIDTSVIRLENNSAGTQVEALLKDPQYGSPIKSKPASPVKAKVTAPTEVKEEETSADQPCFSGSTENALTVNISSQPNGPDTVEKAAKHEAHTMARIAELRRSGMWSNARLPLCVEPPRNKTHWDYVLEEVKWMANDFRQERIWKRGAARKLSTTIARQAREKQAEIEKAEMRVVKDHRRSCAMIARMVKDFWLNVDKVVDHRKQVIIESKKRKALDQHLQFIVGEADKLSQVVAEGIVAESSSKTPSLQGKDDDRDDKDFSGEESESDDERTIAKAEKQLKNVDVKGEVDALGKEADMEFDDLLDSLPPEYLASLGISLPSSSKKTAEETKEEEEEEEEEDSEEEDEEEEEENDSDDEPLARPSSSKSAEEKEPKKEENEDDEPLVKRKKIEVEGEGEGKEEVEVSDDDEPLAEKIRRSREKSKEEAVAMGGGEDEKMEEDEEVDGEKKEDSRESESQEKVKLDNVDFAKLKSDNSDERQQELTHIAEEALKFQPKGYTLETTQVKTGVPHMLRGTLREYQMVGLDWLVTLYDKNLNGILADEMGLGKTIQTVALLAHLACTERIWGPHLIVVPTSVILNWEMEFKKWCPALKILTYFGSVKERAEKRKGWMKDDSFHVCITSYKVITTDIRSFKMRSWQYLILDEAQNIKNWKSQRWQTLLNVRARRRLLLTGTPLQNSLMELWSLLHFLMPAIFASHDDFKDWFSNPLTGMMEGSVEFNKGLLDRLHKVLRPFILRRMKAEVEKQLPEKTEHVVKCPLSKRQRYLYDDFMSQRATRDNLKSGNMMSVLNIVMQLRKCCNHPNLFTPREEQTPLVVPSITRVLPACIFDIVCDDPLRDCVKEIPESLNLANRKAAWRTSVPSKRPPVEALLTMEPALHIPKVPGFKFVRPMPEKTIPGIGQPARAPEMFLVVEEGNDIGGLLEERVQVTVNGGKVMVNTDGKLGAERIRVCQAVPGGSFADVDGESNGRHTWKGSGGLAPPIRESGTTPSISTTSIDSKRSSTSVYSHRRPVAAAHSPIRSTTVLHNSQPPNRVAMNGDESKGRNFNESMQEGILSPISNYTIPLSPPLKRRKVDRPLVSGPYKELVSRDRLGQLEEERRNRLEKAVMRFEDRGEPMYSQQLMSVLWRETRTTRRKGDRWRHSFWEAEWEELGEEVRREYEEMTKNFVIYVDGALAESPSVLVSSLGRTSYARDAASQIKLRASRFLSDCDPLVNRSLVAHRMQLPEVRLIEYDCGKLQILAKLLRELYMYKHRCLIFTQMSRMLDVLQAFLSHHGYQYFRLDGTTGIEQRQAMMERFNADSRIFCFILSTRSGGVGVNLTGADTVIFYDSDWNPTMDAQAQDRCHRIGQTRNVSIYRLISEKTIEENILKKAMQKRRLGEMAIDEAGFTPDFFRQKDNIRDLFDGENVEDLEVDEVEAPANQMELDKAMASLEDEQDVAAAKIVRSEAKADIKEFDERAGGVTVIGGADDGELGALLGQLKPIEKYAIKFLEAEYKPEFEEEVKEAEALLHQKKQEWNRAHEKAMREEEGAEGGDPSLSSLNRDLSLDEEFHDFDVFQEDVFMPTWRPLTPPLSDLDEELYANEITSIFYEDYLMEESELPATIHELVRPLNKYTNSPIKKQPRDTSSHSAVLELLNAASPIVTAEHAAAEAQKNVASLLHQSQSATSIAGGIPSPAPMDSPSVRRASSSSNRKTVRSTYDSMPGRTTKGDMRRPTTPPPAEREAKDYEGPEWTILEDYALLQAVLSEQRLTHMAQNEKSGIKLNWEYISGFVNRVTNNYRSPRQCSVHYQMAVLPREEGRILTIDPLTKKPRKLSLTPNEISHLRKGRTSTQQQYQNDVESVLSYKLVDKMRAVKRVREKRDPPFRRVNPHEIPSTGCPPPNHMDRMRQWDIDPLGPFPPLHETLAAREARRSAQSTQDKETRMAQDAKLAEERERQSMAASISSIIVRPSALPHMAGTLITPPLITLDVPLPPRMHVALPTTQMNQGGGPISIPPSHQQPLNPPANPNPLMPHQQSHPMAEHMPSMGGLTRRVGTPLGGGGSQGMMGSGGGQGIGRDGRDGSSGGPPSQYIVVGGDGREANQQGVQVGRDGGERGGMGPSGREGGGGQSQQVASRMNLLAREGGNASGSSGGPPQAMYRTIPPPPKRAAPGGISRMYMGEGGAPPQQVQVAQRGPPVGGRAPFNPQRVPQRVMPGGQANRVYLSGTGSGSASPSQGGQSMGGDGGGVQSVQGGRQYLMSSGNQTMRVGIPPPRTVGPMGGNGGGPQKRTHSIVPQKNQPGAMLVARAGTGIGHMRGAQQINRFPSGTGASQQSRVLVREGAPQGTLIRGTMNPSGGMSMGGPSSLQSRSIPPHRTLVNPTRNQPTLHLPSLDTPSSSGPPPSSHPSSNPSDSIPPSQGGALPSISLSNPSSSNSFPQ